MLIPEVILYRNILIFQKLVTDDWNDLPDNEKDKSILYSLFKHDDNGDVLELDKYDYYTQAVSMIVAKDIENARHLEVGIGYNMQRLAVPTIHVLLPSEAKGRFDSIGTSEGEPASVYDPARLAFIITKSKTFATTYHLMITSDNSSEVLTIYYWLRAMFIMFSEHVSLQGLLNMQFSGQDIQMNQDITPPNIFHRNLSVAFDFESHIKMAVPATLVNKYKVGVCDGFAQDVADYNNS